MNTYYTLCRKLGLLTFIFFNLEIYLLSKSELVKFLQIQSVIFLFTDSPVKKYISLLNQWKKYFHSCNQWNLTDFQ